MPALLPVLLLGSQIVLAADPVPQLDASLSCRSAGASSAMGKASGSRTAAACEKDENDARGLLEQQWSTFSQSEQARCTRISTLGGSPSYVELLTCLELAKAAKLLPPGDQLRIPSTDIER